MGKTASRPCGPTLPRRGRRVGMHSQVGVFRELRATDCHDLLLVRVWELWGTYMYCTHARIAHACCTVLGPRTVSHHSMPDHFLFIYCGIIIHPLGLGGLGLALWACCAAASISAQVGWRPAAMTKTKGGRELGASERPERVRHCTVPGTVPCTVVTVVRRYVCSVLVPRKSVCSPCPAGCSVSLVYTACRAPCIRTWKVGAIHNTHTRTPSTHPLAHTFVMTVSLLYSAYTLYPH